MLLDEDNDTKIDTMELMQFLEKNDSIIEVSNFMKAILMKFTLQPFLTNIAFTPKLKLS